MVGAGVFVVSGVMAAVTATVAIMAAKQGGWPFTAGETVTILVSAGGVAVAIIGATKSNAAKAEANATKLAVNGHLAKLEKEQETGKREREVEWAKLLQATRESSVAEGKEIARLEAEATAAKVRDALTLAQASATPPPHAAHPLPVSVVEPSPALKKDPR